MTQAILNTIRYFTETTPYHYTYDNQPLQDLEGNDQLLNAAIASISSNSNIQRVTGNWTGLTVDIDTTEDIGHPFAYKITVWAIEDYTQLSGQVATLLQDIVFAYNTSPGTVSILSTTHSSTANSGSTAATIAYTGSGNNIVVTPSGYTGANGILVVKTERFGLT